MSPSTVSSETLLFGLDELLFCLIAKRVEFVPINIAFGALVKLPVRPIVPDACKFAVLADVKGKPVTLIAPLPVDDLAPLTLPVQ